MLLGAIGLLPCPAASGACPDFKDGVHRFVRSYGLEFVSIARAELLINDAESFEFAEDDARLQALLKIAEEVPESWLSSEGELQGVEEIETCREGNFAVGGVKISERSVASAMKAAAEINASLAESPTPTE